MKKILSSLFIIVASFLFINEVNAGSLSITASNLNPTVGSTITITVKSNNVYSKYYLTSTNSSVISPGATKQTDIDTGGVTTYSFTANAVGTATIKLISVDATDYDTVSYYTATPSVTINVKAKPVIVLSGDNSLSGLGVDGKELSPAFNRDTLEYSVELEPETTSINVWANPSHGGASIAGAGTREVVDGSNRLEIVVTAENGSSRTYVLNASVKEYNPIKQTVDGKEYSVVRKRSMLTAPENYVETTVTIEGEEVPAFTSEVTKYTLVGLKNESGTIGLYVYKDGTYMPYNEYTFNKVIFYPLELDINDIPKGYEKTDIIYNDQTIVAYKTSELSNFAILYGMNVETGEVHMYMYDEEEDTLQIYNDEMVSSLQEELEQMKLIVAALAGVSAFLFLLCIIIGSSKGKSRKEKNQNTLDSIDDIKVTEIQSTKLSKREEKRIIKEEQQRKLEADKNFKKEEKKRLKEEARKLKEELKQEKKNKKNKKEKDKPIDIREL